MSDRDRRVVLWLCCAGICWRWFIGIRAPVPGVDACNDLWLAGEFAAGSFASLAEYWTQPLYPLLLAPAIACGASPFAAAQVLACLCGGLAMVPVAIAAERLRAGAGVPAAVVTMVAAGPVLAAGVGAATALSALLVAIGLWAVVARRWVLAGLLLTYVAIGGCERTGSVELRSFDQLRLGLGAACLMLPLLLVPPRRRALAVPFVAFAGLLGIAWFSGTVVELLPIYSPVLALLAAAGAAQLPVRLRDLLMCLVVVAECHAAWTLPEPRSAVVERVLPQYLIRRVHAADEKLASTLPRVRWAAGQQPLVAASLEQILRHEQVGSVVLSATQGADATLRALMASRFALAELPYDLQDLVDAHGLVVLRRRPE